MLSVATAINPRAPSVMYSTQSMGKPVMVYSPIEVQTIYNALHEVSFAEQIQIEMQARLEDQPDRPVEIVNPEQVILSKMDRHNSVEKTHWRYQKRKSNGTAPTVVFHGIRQVCTEHMLTDLVEKV